MDDADLLNRNGQGLLLCVVSLDPKGLCNGKKRWSEKDGRIKSLRSSGRLLHNIIKSTIIGGKEHKIMNNLLTTGDINLDKFNVINCKAVECPNYKLLKDISNVKRLRKHIRTIPLSIKLIRGTKNFNEAVKFNEGIGKL
ncbi:Peptidyl-tRNA hydrolase [Dirofilaria immitis]